MRKNVQGGLPRPSPDFGIFPRVNHPGSAPVEGFLPKIEDVRTLVVVVLVGTTRRQLHAHLPVRIPQIHGRTEDPVVHLDQRRILVSNKVLKCGSRRLEH